MTDAQIEVLVDAAIAMTIVEDRINGVSGIDLVTATREIARGKLRAAFPPPADK